ncbi:MAG: hypothetical protein IPM52_09720 [Bacteroidetes bacterium]|nr:hypothetical protein [Bacteroidota bacterium]
MKTTIKSSAAIFVFLFCFLIAEAQRNVAWIHGLEGDEGSWAHYEQIFTLERNIISLRETYNTSNGLNTAAVQVIASTNSFCNPYDTNNLGIGHSMGGLMLRQADRITSGSNKRFGGYITVASPNYGAPIANSVLDGSVQSAASVACNKLADGPLAELFILPWGIYANLTTNAVCNFIAANANIQSLAGSPTTINDLKVGSQIIQQLKAHTDNSSIPRISVWAEETSPVHWRMFSTEIYNNDLELVDKIGVARNVYNAYYGVNLTKAIAAAIGALYNPLLLPLSALYTYRSTQWKKGRDWFDDSENIWCGLIKSTETQLVTYWSYELICEPDPSGYYECLYYYWDWVPRTRFVSVNTPNDGLLPKHTQVLNNIPAENIYRVYGANHLEIRNMSQCTLNGQPNDAMRQRFNEIFNRQPSDWFQTPVRQ